MQATWNYPRLIAHRGAGKLSPENTLSAMRTGKKHGYSMVEYDVKLSADDVPFLLHDDTLDRTTDGNGDAGIQPYSSLALLDAGSWHSQSYAGEAVPSLRAIARYTQACDIISNVEIKPSPGREHETGVKVALAVQALWKNSAVPPLLSSFSEISLAAAAQAAPDLPRGLLLENELPHDWIARANSYGCVSVHLDNKIVQPHMVQAAHEAGLRLAIWTVNDPERARQLTEWGVDAIITDALDRIDPA